MDAWEHLNKKDNLGKILAKKKFFFRFQHYYLLDIVLSCNHGQYQGKLMMEPWENGKNLILILNPIWGLKKFFKGFIWSIFQAIIPCSFQKNWWTKLEKVAKNLILGLILGHLAQIWASTFFFFFCEFQLY